MTNPHNRICGRWRKRENPREVEMGFLKKWSD